MIKDDLTDKAIEIVQTTGRASIAALQRRLRIGYMRAARIMDGLEEQGIVGPPDHLEPRKVLIDTDGNKIGEEEA